jgi:hypothetical protein
MIRVRRVIVGREACDVAFYQSVTGIFRVAGRLVAVRGLDP